MNDLMQYIKRVSKATDETLEKLLPPETSYPFSIHKLMRYSTFAGGKRVRPCLLMASHEACGEVSGIKALWLHQQHWRCFILSHLSMMIFLAWMMMIFAG